MPPVRRKHEKKHRTVRESSAWEGEPERPRTTTRGRPRNAEPPRPDGFSEGTCRNVVGRYGWRRVRALIRAWEAGKQTDAQLGAKFGISGSVMRRWRRAFGIRSKTWTPIPEVSSLLPGDAAE